MNYEHSSVKRYNGLLILVLGEQEYCTDIRNIMAIIRPEELERYYQLYIPRIALLNRYDSTFPIVNTKKYFGNGNGEITSQTRIVLIKCDKAVLGLYVNSVKEVVSLSKKNDENNLEFTSSEGNLFIKGTVKFEDQHWLLPDFEKICCDMLSD